MVFLKTLLIILLVYFAIKILSRYLGPLLLKYIFKKVQRNMENQFNPNRSEKTNESKKSGKTFKSKSRDSKVGEYIDYEEID